MSFLFQLEIRYCQLDIAIMSIIDPSTCGFVKIFCYRVFTDKNLIKRNPSENMNCYKSRVLHYQYNAFQSTFCESSLISYDKFRENFQHIVHNIQTLGKKYPEKKRHVMDIFSLKNWVDLKERKFEHSIFDCSGCLRNESWKDALAMFPVRGFLQQAKAKRLGLVERNVLQDKTKAILNELNQNYRKNYRTTFTKQVKEVLEMPKPREIAKSIKTDIENQWAETCVERYFMLQKEMNFKI